MTFCRKDKKGVSSEKVITSPFLLNRGSQIQSTSQCELSMQDLPKIVNLNPKYQPKKFAFTSLNILDKNLHDD